MDSRFIEINFHFIHGSKSHKCSYIRSFFFVLDLLLILVNLRRTMRSLIIFITFNYREKIIRFMDINLHRFVRSFIEGFMDINFFFVLVLRSTQLWRTKIDLQIKIKAINRMIYKFNQGIVQQFIAWNKKAKVLKI